jgi:hypothetical protein
MPKSKLCEFYNLCLFNSNSYTNSDADTNSYRHSGTHM